MQQRSEGDADNMYIGGDSSRVDTPATESDRQDTGSTTEHDPHETEDYQNKTVCNAHAESQIRHVNLTEGADINRHGDTTD